MTGLEFAVVLYTIAFGTRLDLFWNDYLVRTFWRMIAIPAIQIFAVASRLLFAWTFSRGSEMNAS